MAHLQQVNVLPEVGCNSYSCFRWKLLSCLRLTLTSAHGRGVSPPMLSGLVHTGLQWYLSKQASTWVWCWE